MGKRGGLSVCDIIAQQDSTRAAVRKVWQERVDELGDELAAAKRELAECREILEQDSQARRELQALLGQPEQCEADWGWGKVYHAVDEAVKMHADAKRENERLRGALGYIAEFPKESDKRRDEEGYPMEITYDEFAYKRMVDAYRYAARKALSDTDGDSNV